MLLAVVGTLVYNFPTFLTLMAHDTFHGGAGLAGFLMAILGVGTVIGALAAALRARPTARTVIGTGALLGIAPDRRRVAVVAARVRDRAGARRRAGGVLRLDRERPHADLVGAASCAGA